MLILKKKYHVSFKVTIGYIVEACSTEDATQFALQRLLNGGMPDEVDEPEDVTRAGVSKR